MRHETIRSIGAATAIAAVLALGSTPAAAQEAAPTIVLPPTDAAPAAPAAVSAPPAAVQQPTIVLPPVALEPAPQAAAPEAATETRAAPRQATRPAPRAVERAAPAAGSAAAAPAATVSPAAEAAALPPAAPIPAPPVVAEPVAAAVPPPGAETGPASDADSGLGAEASLAALAGAVALIGAGVLVMRRRRRSDALEADAAFAPEPAAALPPIGTPRAVAMEEPAMPQMRPTAASYAFYDRQPPLDLREADAAMTDREGAPALPAEVPTGAAREALLRRMVDAAPDADNPFTSRKGRRRRARLMLQARANRQQQAAGDQPFDWRSYRSSTRDAPAHPPRVTA